MPALCYSEDTKLNDALRLGLLLDNAFTTDALVKLELDNLDLEDELPTDLIEAWRESRLEALSGANAVRREAICHSLNTLSLNWGDYLSYIRQHIVYDSRNQYVGIGGGGNTQGTQFKRLVT
ncbi:uncharacterized protein MELLADRAFT_114185 [Melampsora larici-populina 98AG31]|uniref:Uncharacterized protein n=1 Tax=Melampsora larici-populina (strain 98AG31 / pathotype 3-4-7) TaxID=747676 RepID=F4SCI8_MELLP|nr:uncharacterized protein MELLADRAFT_114185 [Melampsora larici-populina 98AG31]EGF97630.1 hypothetical protein MELLADRAFT_114185 [Melampsora larici-populina 98AG31]